MNDHARAGLAFLRELKSVTFATVSDAEPAARIIDVMIVDDEGLWFITARGKPFYRELLASGSVAIVGMNSTYKSARLVGKVRHMPGREVVDRVFEQNPVMNALYPGESRYVLEGFLLHSARGEFFDLSVEPPTRERFAFGGAQVNPVGYEITDECIACGNCAEACPVGVIAEGDPYTIDRSGCLECGLCAEVCPVDAILPARGL